MKELFEVWNQHLLDEAKEDTLKKKYERKIATHIISYLNRWVNESEKGASLRKQRIKYLPWMYKQAAVNPNFQYNQESYDQWIKDLKGEGWTDEQIANGESSISHGCISRLVSTLIFNIVRMLMMNGRKR